MIRDVPYVRQLQRHITRRLLLNREIELLNARVLEMAVEERNIEGEEWAEIEIRRQLDGHKVQRSGRQRIGQAGSDRDDVAIEGGHVLCHVIGSLTSQRGVEDTPTGSQAGPAVPEDIPRET